METLRNKNLMPYQKVDRSNWSLHDFILEGTTISWEAQEMETLESNDPYKVSNVHGHFLIWYLELKENFFPRNNYLDPITGHNYYSEVMSLYEAGKVPRLKGGSEEYRDPKSEKSQKLLRNISEETKKILETLRRLNTTIPLPKTDRTSNPSKKVEINITYNIKLGRLIFNGNNNKLINIEGKQKDVMDCLIKQGKDTKVSWDEIYETFKDRVERDDMDKEKRCVRTAVTGINKHTEKYLKKNKDLIDSKNNEYWLQYVVDKGR